MNINRIEVALLAALACLAPVSAAEAATVTFTQVVAPTAAPKDYIAPFSQFDPALGTLTGAELSVNATTAGYSYIENLTSSGFFAFGGGQGGIEVNMPTVDNIGAFSTWGSNNVFVPPFDGAADLAGPDSVYNNGTDTSSISSSFSNPSDLTKFIGTHFLFGEISVFTDTGFDSYSYARFLRDDTISGDVSITYTYTPNSTGPVDAIPEPSSWALMLLGTAGIGAALRAGRRKAFRSTLAGR